MDVKGRTWMSKVGHGIDRRKANQGFTKYALNYSLSTLI